MKNINILVVDSTYLGKNPNRAKTLAHIQRWMSAHFAVVYIYTTPNGWAFYTSNISALLKENLRFIQIPFASDHEKIHLLAIPIEYLKRIAGALFAKIPSDIAVSYSISSIIVDVASSLILKMRNTQMVSFSVFDNFVPGPLSRPGKYIYKLIPYVAYLATMRLIRFMDGVFSALTASNHAILIQMLGSKSTIFKTPNGLNLGMIASVPNYQKEYDLIYLGRMHPAKGIFDFIKVGAQVKKSRPNVKLLVVGPEDITIKEELNRLIAKYDIGPNITFAGFVPTSEKYELLKKSKMFLFLSYDESFPISFMEAIVCGLPVVAYDLEVYGDSPYSQSYRQIFKRGDIEGVSGYVGGFLQAYEANRVAVDLFYQNKSIINDFAEIADIEYQSFLDLMPL